MIDSAAIYAFWLAKGLSMQLINMIIGSTIICCIIFIGWFTWQMIKLTAHQIALFWK